MHTPDHTTFKDAQEVAELAAILAPFVNARFHMARDENGYVIPRKRYVDITTAGITRMDADIRGLDQNGIECVRLGGFADPIAWSEITKVVVRGEDGSAVAFGIGGGL